MQWLKSLTRAKPRWVYFMQRDTDGLIKIGCTNELPRRAATLRRQFGRMQLLGVVPQSQWKEREVHSMFSDFRIVGRRAINREFTLELFEPDKIILKFVKANAEWNKDCDLAQAELTREDRRIGSAIRANGLIDTINMGRSTAAKIARAYDVDISSVQYLMKHGKPPRIIEL